MSVKLLVVVSLCCACSTEIPQPERPDPPVGEFDIHTRIEGVSLQAPDDGGESQRMRLRIAGVHPTEELITRFVSRAQLAGALAVSDLTIDAVVQKHRRLYRCSAHLVAQREERLVDRTRTIPAHVEVRHRSFIVITSKIRPVFVIEPVEVPEEIVRYKQVQSGLRTWLSNERCRPVADLDEQPPNVVSGRVHFASAQSAKK